MTNSPTILTPASTRAENARHAEAEAPNGNGFYRFKIGDFQATEISDGYARTEVQSVQKLRTERRLLSEQR